MTTAFAAPGDLAPCRFPPVVRSLAGDGDDPGLTGLVRVVGHRLAIQPRGDDVGQLTGVAVVEGMGGTTDHDERDVVGRHPRDLEHPVRRGQQRVEAAEHRYKSVAGGTVPENMESLWTVISRGKNRFVKVRFKG